MTTEANTLLAAFDALAAQQPDVLAQRLTDAGIPAAAQHPAQADLALVMAAMRAALASWSPRPPLQNAEDQTALHRALADIVAAEVNTVATPYLERAGKSIMRTRKRLTDWNTARAERLSKPSYADRAALRDTEPEDPDEAHTMERVDHGDGTFSFRYRVKPDVVDLTLRRAEERSKHERNE